MGADQDLIQGTVVLLAAMMGALLDGTLDTLVCMAVHKKASFEIGFGNSMDRFPKTMQPKVSNVAKTNFLCYSLCYRKLWPLSTNK